MEAFAQQTSKDRAEVFSETAARRGIDSVLIVEKDFWVCWTLKRLFGLQDSASHMLFKGGTSLSKAFELIERFSEDIDISIDRHQLGFVGDRDPSEVGSKKRERLLKELRIAADAHVRDELLPGLEADFSASLGPEVWSLAVDPREPQTLRFTYPASLRTQDYGNFSYLAPSIRLEFGARGAQWPANLQSVTPYAAEAFPDLFDEPAAQIRTLDAERTFWEKATILHKEFHRGVSVPTGDRLSRHYYDLAMLARSPVRHRALKKLDLLRDVAEHKASFFRAAWAKYEDAKPGSLRLAPHQAREPSLRSDYSKMQEMIFGEAPDFEAVVGSLRDLEHEINGFAGD